MSATNNTDEISKENISKVFPEQHVQEDMDAGKLRGVGINSA